MKPNPPIAIIPLGQTPVIVAKQDHSEAERDMPDHQLSDLAEACEAEAVDIVSEYIGKISGGTLIPFNTMHNADVLL